VPAGTADLPNSVTSNNCFLKQIPLFIGHPNLFQHSELLLPEIHNPLLFVLISDGFNPNMQSIKKPFGLRVHGRCLP